MSKIIFTPYSLRNMRSKSKKEAEDGYTATLLRDGEPVAHINCGTAADNDDLEITFSDIHEQQIFKAHASRVVPNKMATMRMGKDEVLLRELAESVYQAQRLEYQLGTATLYRLSGDRDGVWRKIKSPFRPALAAAIRAKHGHSQVEIANAVN